MPNPSNELLRCCWFYIAFPLVTAIYVARYYIVGGKGYDVGHTNCGVVDL